MRRFWLLSLILCCLPATAQQVSSAARQQDLSFVSDQLPKLHPNFYFQLDPALFQQAVSMLSSKLATVTDAEFYVGLAQLVAMAGDGHTSILLFGSPAATIGFHTFPLTFRWLDDGVFVTAAPAPYARAVGAQLVALGSTPIAQVIAQLGTVISHSNDPGVQSLAQQYLAGQQILQGLGILPPGSPSSLTFRSLSGEEFTLQVATDSGPSVTAPDPTNGLLPDYLHNTGLNYWYTYSAANRLLYFKYNRCVEDPARPFASFAADLLQTLDENPVDTFVFDFRGNSGGADGEWDPLANGLSARLPSLVANPRFRFYAAIDKGTASSAMDNAMDLKQPFPPQLTAAFPGVDFSQLAVQLVGEPTSGKPAEYGSVQQLFLPGSGLLAQYSTKYLPNPSYVPDLPSLMPDIGVRVRSTDYFARHDPVMAAILARTPNPPSPPSGSAIAVNGAGYRIDQGIAPGSVATVFGAFSQTPDEVLVSGSAAKILSALTSQVNFIIPSSLSPGLAAISVRASGAELASGQFSISPAGPGIFILDTADPSQPGAVENQDYSTNSAANPAKAGSVVQIFATGSPALDSSGQAPVQVYVGGVPAQVSFSGPVAPGLWQINAQAPAGIAGQVPVFLVASGLTSNAVTIYLQ